MKISIVERVWRFFVRAYIMRNMSHERPHNRRFILKTIVDSMDQCYTEDNKTTRFQSLVEWLDKQWQSKNN